MSVRKEAGSWSPFYPSRAPVCPFHRALRAPAASLWAAGTGRVVVRGDRHLTWPGVTPQCLLGDTYLEVGAEAEASGECEMAHLAEGFWLLLGPLFHQ